MIIMSGKELIFILDDTYYNVDTSTLSDESKINIKKYENKAYVIGSYVYPYRGKMKDTSTDIGLYKGPNGLCVIKPKTKEEKERFNVHNILSLGAMDIGVDVEGNTDNFIRPEDIEVINNNTDIYTPTIRPQDDFLKYIVKKVILDKSINLKNYKEKFKNEYSLNNMKSGLGKSTKMTVTNFAAWCEVLGIGWEITVRDDGTDNLRPLKDPIKITSEDF